MRAPRSCGRIVALIMWTSGLVIDPGDWILPRTRAQPVSTWTEQAFRDALANTRSRGLITVVVCTASEQPDSFRLWTQLRDGTWARQNRGLVQLIELSKDRDPVLIRSLGVTRFPTAVAYGLGPQGLRLLAAIPNCSDIDALTAQLRGLDSRLGGSSRIDNAVQVAGLHSGDIAPSQQMPSPPVCPSPPAAAPPSNPAPPQAAPPGAPPSPAPAPVAMAPAGLIQVPSPNLMIQQAPAQVFMAPPQPPIIYMPQAAPPAAAPANVFLPPAAAPTTPAPPMMAVAAVPQPAAAPPAANVNNQLLSMPSNGSMTMVRVTGPGFLRSALARLGAWMVQLGQARIETINSTTLQSPYAQAAPGGLTTIQTTSAVPAPPPQAAPPAPPAAPPQAAPPQPSPQGIEKPRHRWFHNDN
jgi:hypothetical protein